jgi:DeoR family transcriptional regulator, suf operon transcriptional repressor
MKTSRQQVLEYVHKQRVVTAGDLSQAMQMTEANARHHLSILAAEGLVTIVGRRPPRGKGRPEHLYGLSEQVAGHNLDRLASVLLNEMLTGVTEEQRVQVLSRLADQMSTAVGFGSAQESVDEIVLLRSAHLTQRLYQAVRLLNGRHYEARWEAHAIAPRLILGHCPYVAIIEDHPELCQLDRRLLERLVGAAASQTAKRQSDPHGARQCVFVIRKA